MVRSHKEKLDKEPLGFDHPNCKTCDWCIPYENEGYCLHNPPTRTDELCSQDFNITDVRSDYCSCWSFTGFVQQKKQNPGIVSFGTMGFRMQLRRFYTGE